MLAGTLAGALVVGGFILTAKPGQAAPAPYAVSTISSFFEPDGIVFAPDGKTAYVIDEAAMVGSQYTMFVVSTSTNTITRTITAPSLTAPVAEAINPAGTDVYVLNDNGTVTVVSTVTDAVTAVIGTPNPSEYFPYPGHQEIVISPDGKTAYVAQYSLGVVSVLNLTANTVTRTISVSDPEALALTPNGAELYVSIGFAANSPTVEVISTATNTVTGSVNGLQPDGLYESIDVSPNGSTLYIVDGEGYLYVASTASNTVTKTITGFSDEPEDSVLSPAGSTLYIAEGSYVGVVDTASGTLTHEIPLGPVSPGLSPGVTALAASPNGGTVYVAGGQYGLGELGIITTATATLTGFVASVGFNPLAIAFSPNGQQAYVANGGTGSIAASVTVIDTATGIATATIQLPIHSGPDGIAVSPDGKTIYVADSGSVVTFGDTVSVINAATGTVTGMITVGRVPAGIAFSPDGTTAYVANSQDDTVSVIDVASGTVIDTINVGTSPGSVAVSPDGGTIYVGTEQGVSVIDTATRTVTATISKPDVFGPFGVVLSPNGQTLYASSDSGLVVINAKTDEVTSTNSAICVIHLAISPDGKTLYTTCGGEVQTISTATDSVTATINDPSFNPTDANPELQPAVSPNGKSIYVADGPDNSVHVLTPVTHAPAITSKTAATFKVGAKGTFTVTTSGIPAPAITESGTLPKGITFKGNGNGTATLSGTPAAGTGKVYTLTIKANNGVGAVAGQTFKLTVDQAPKVTSAAKATFIYHKKASFEIKTTGYPAVSTITESGALPKGLTFKNNKNGTATISGTPQLKATKTYTLTIKATNGVTPTAVQTFKLALEK